MYKKGDIIKIQNPYGPAGTTSYFHCLITETRKHYMYNVLYLETGETDVLNKNYVFKNAVQVA
jgi:hypothetical protein